MHKKWNKNIIELKYTLFIQMGEEIKIIFFGTFYFSDFSLWELIKNKSIFICAPRIYKHQQGVWC